MKALHLVVRNASLVTSAGRRNVDIGIADGRFAAIEAPGSLEGAEEVDATGLIGLPGVIDAHVHFREPGLEHEETWLTGSRAAVMGGVTTVLDMPNTLPPTDTVERAMAKLELATASAHCDFGIFGLLGPSIDQGIELAETGLVAGLKVFMGPTTGDLAAPDDDGLRRGLHAARRLGLRVCFHAEDRSTVATAERSLRDGGRSDPRAHGESRPVEAELAAIERVGRLLIDSGAAGHILHLSSAEGLAAVEFWRSRGADLTCEVTPHHLLLEGGVYDRFGGLAKVNPPIRGEPNASALMAALADGRIQDVASDHAPHTAADKSQASIWDVPAGIAGVETLLPLLLTEVARGRLSLERLAQVTSEGPAKAWRLWPRKGRVEAGADGDLTLLDLDREGVIRAAGLHGKNSSTPFEGRRTRGAAVATIIRGQIVMRDGEMLAEPGWGRNVVAHSRRAR